MGKPVSSLLRHFSLTLLTWVLLLGFFAQAPLAKMHEFRHFSERLLMSAQAMPVLDTSGCVVCDGVQLVPEAPSITVALNIAPFVESAEVLPPIFFSDNAILLPLGARAPPFFSAATA